MQYVMIELPQPSKVAGRRRSPVFEFRSSVETKTFTGFLGPQTLTEFGGGRLAGPYSDLVAVGTRVQIPPSAL